MTKKRTKKHLTERLPALLGASMGPGKTVTQLTCPHLHCSALPNEYPYAVCQDCGAKARLQIKKTSIP